MSKRTFPKNEAKNNIDDVMLNAIDVRIDILKIRSVCLGLFTCSHFILIFYNLFLKLF